MKIKITFSLCLLLFRGGAQSPEITSWIVNTTGATGYSGIPSNVQLVQYSPGNVYVSSKCIPGYDIGPWQGNPNIPSNQNFLFKITRSPVQNLSTPTIAGLGHIGVWSNGVSIFNAKDGMSYNNAGTWNRNALYYEGLSFDTCLGHPAPNGEYHHHVNPACLYNDADSLSHSPIIGYAFDGFPVYGAYGFTGINGTGPIKRMKSSYVLSSSTTRNNGPAVAAPYPAGCFVEDYIYTPGAGDLDEHNGRYCQTPEYPSGTYAYFVTINGALDPVYPFVIGPTYYGTVQAGNTGPGSGHNTISEQVSNYIPTAIEDHEISILKIYPVPARDHVTVSFEHTIEKLVLLNMAGQLILMQEPAKTELVLDLSRIVPGVYFLTVRSGNSLYRKIMVVE